MSAAAGTTVADFGFRVLNPKPGTELIAGWYESFYPAAGGTVAHLGFHVAGFELIISSWDLTFAEQMVSQHFSNHTMAVSAS